MRKERGFVFSPSRAAEDELALAPSFAVGSTGEPCTAFVAWFNVVHGTRGPPPHASSLTPP